MESLELKNIGEIKISPGNFDGILDRSIESQIVTLTSVEWTTN
jgi:hypothetical protein